jgi:hypothetical protein
MSPPHGLHAVSLDLLFCLTANTEAITAEVREGSLAAAGIAPSPRLRALASI